MAISTPNFTGKTSFSSRSDNKGKVRQSATREYDMTSSAPATDTDVDAINALAAIGVVNEAPHPVLGTAFRVKDIQFRHDTQSYWVATVVYQTPEFDSGNPGETAPWHQPAIVDAEDSSTDEPIDEDINGDPIITVNGEPIEGLTRPVSDLVLRIRKNFLFFESNAYYTYKDAVNSDDFLGFPPGTLRVVGLSAQEQVHDGQKYAAVTVSIAARKPYRTTTDKAWWKRVKHEGYYINDGEGNIVHARDDAKQLVSRPVLLGVAGERLAAGADANWLEFEVFESVPFSGMGLF